jgi:hypothetical protein
MRIFTSTGEDKSGKIKSSLETQALSLAGRAVTSWSLPSPEIPIWLL